MRSRPDPADSSMWPMFPKVRRICSAIGPSLRPPVTGSTGPIPDRKIMSPTRMPGEWGRLALRDTLSRGLTGSITLRETGSVIGSGQRHAVDLDLVAADQPGSANRPGGRIAREEFAVHVIHVPVLQHRIDQHIDLDYLGERRTGRSQQLRHAR